MKPSIEKRYFTITEVSKELDVKPSMLRYWEKEFRQLTPRTNGRGKRFYTRKDIELIQQIHQLVKVERFTLDGARRALAARAEQQSQVAPAAQAAIAPATTGSAEPQRTGGDALGVDEATRQALVAQLEGLREKLLALKRSDASAVNAAPSVPPTSAPASSDAARNPESLTRAW